MRLRNRQLKATYWTDPELLRWPRDKRLFYASLRACAEDSCCLEEDMLGVKYAAWVADADMTPERFEVWLEELVRAHKAVRYEGPDGKNYLYLPAMARHENPRNPQPPDYPLPPWVRCSRTADARGAGRTAYTHEDWRAFVTEPPPAATTDFIPEDTAQCEVLEREEAVSPDPSIDPMRTLLFTAFASFPTVKDVAALRDLADKYGTETPTAVERVEYGILVATETGHPSVAYALAVAARASKQEIEHYGEPKGGTGGGYSDEEL